MSAAGSRHPQPLTVTAKSSAGWMPVPTKAKKKRQARKAGTSAASAQQRKRLFALAFIENGGNKRAAAIAAGYKEGRAADKAGERLSQDVAVKALIEEARKEAVKTAGLSVERTLQEVARVAYFDVRKLFKEDGTMKPAHELDDDTAAALSQIDVDEIVLDKVVVGHTRKIKVFDKNAALEKAMKHLGLYEKDNKQQGNAAVAALLAAVGQQDAGFAVKPS